MFSFFHPCQSFFADIDLAPDQVQALAEESDAFRSRTRVRELGQLAKRLIGRGYIRLPPIVFEEFGFIRII